MNLNKALIALALGLALTACNKPADDTAAATDAAATATDAAATATDAAAAASSAGAMTQIITVLI